MFSTYMFVLWIAVSKLVEILFGKVGKILQLRLCLNVGRQPIGNTVYKNNELQEQYYAEIETLSRKYGRIFT